MELRNAFLFFSVFAIALSIGCRVTTGSQEVNDGDMTVDEPSTPKPHTIHVDSNDVSQPITEIDWRLPPSDEEETEEYISEVHFNAACDWDPVEIVVVAGHTEPALCEHIIGIAVYDDHGDTYDIAWPFDWSNDTAFDISMNCMHGPHDDFCWATGHHDIFDSWDNTEPTAFIMGCVNNTCADTMPNCEPIICHSIVAVSVVNLEGAWVSTWGSVPDGETLVFTQDARMFEDAMMHTKNGFIDGAHVSFDKGDYHFEGDLSSDRATIMGSVTDLILGSPAGSWLMVRATP